MATNKQIKQQIKNATTAVTPKVNTNYKAGDYEKLNPSVQKAAETTVTNATNSANQAYQLAAKNNQQHASEAHANNNMTTRQIGSSMKKNNYSLTNRNVASAASARSASTINTAHTNANRNAEVTRDTSISKAKQTAYKNMAENMLSNSKLDIQRSTERAKVKAEQHMTSKENQKERNLKNALYRKNAKLEKKQYKLNKKKDNLSSYTSAIPNRLTTVKAVDNAIASMKKSKDPLKSQKLAYLRSYRASLKKAEAARKSSGGGRGSYDLAVAAAKDWMDRGGYMGSKITIAPGNLIYMNDAIKHMVDLGYHEINANTVYEKGWTIDHARTFYVKLKEIADYFIDNDLVEDYYLSLFPENQIGKPKDEEDLDTWCGGVGNAMLAIDPDGNLYPCLRYMPSSLGNDQPPLIFGTVWDGIGKTAEHAQWVKCLACITRRTESTDECFYCPIAEGCAECSAYNYQMNGTPDSRCTYICDMHKARVLANSYYWNKWYRKRGEPQRFKLYIPEDWALEIIDKDEFEMLKKLAED